MTDDHTYGRVNAAHAAKLLHPVETHVSKKESQSSKPVQVSLVNQLETLAAEIEKINPISSRIDTLNELAWRWRYREKEQALQICLHTRQLSQTAEYEEHPYQIGLATGLATSSFIHQIRYDLDEAMTEAIQALTILEGFPLLPAASDARISIGWINLTVGDFSTALEYALPALQIAREIHDLERQAYALDALGNIYCKSSDYDHALENHHEALQLAEKIAIPEISMILFNNLANTLFEMKRFSEALPYSLKAIDLARNLGLLSEELIVITTISEILVGLKSFEEAGMYLQDALTKYQNSNLAQPYVFMLIMFGLAGLNMDQEKYPIAEPFLFQALEIARQCDFKTTQMFCHQQLCTIYENTDQYRLVLEHFKQFHALQVSVSGKDMARKIALLKAEYRIELSRREAESFRTQNRELMHEIEERKRAEDAMRESNGLLSAFMQYSPIYIFIKAVTPTTSRVLKVSDNFQDMIGIPAAEMVGKTMQELFPPELAAQMTADDWSVVCNGDVLELNEELDGHTYSSFKFPFSVGEKTLLAGYSLDITERKRIEQALAQTTARLTLAVRAGGVGTWEYDLINDRLTWDDQMYHLYGITPQDFSGAYDAWQQGLHPQDRKHSDDEIQAARRGEKEFDTEFRVIWPDGSVHDIRALALVQRDQAGEPLSMLGTNWDVTDQKRILNQLQLSVFEKDALLLEVQKLARTDALTGLNNLRYFNELAGHAFEVTRRYHQPLSLIMFDIDKFKNVNDNFGHSVGDQVLIQTAQVVSSQLRATDIFGRIGGDEFVIILPGTNAQQAFPMAERIRAEVALRTLETAKQPVTVTISMGIAGIAENSKDDNLETLLRQADLALYAAKAAGRNEIIIYQLEMG